MSGRGLGFSGGTLDKMESIPGYRTNLSREEFLHQLKTLGLVLTGQTGDLAPADGKLYGLRDVTGTVQSIPLIASSVMSKKIAAGAQAIVLDVKVGVGAFMENLEDARQLSKLMVAIGRLSGRKVIALLSDMNQPLGNAVGNALEVKEAIATLHGAGPADFREHCLTVASHLLVLGHKAAALDEARRMAEESLAQGRAWNAFHQLVAAQGGDVRYVDQPDLLPKASLIETVQADREGYLLGIHAREVGETSVELGAGRSKKTDPIDYAVGIEVHHKVGDFVRRGEALFTVHANRQDGLEAAKIRLLAAHQWSEQPCQPLPLFYGVIQD
jgi:pyrimidine-nucleoside phosphorylase